MIQTATFTDPDLGRLNIDAVSWRCNLPATIRDLFIGNVPNIHRGEDVLIGGRPHILAQLQRDHGSLLWHEVTPAQYIITRSDGQSAGFRLAEAVVPAGAHAERRAVEMAERCRSPHRRGQIRHVVGGGLCLPHGVRLDGLGRPKRAVTVDGIVVNSIIDSAVVTGQPWLALGGFLRDHPGTPLAALPVLARIALQFSGRDWAADLQGASIASIAASIRSHQEVLLCSA
ncbi:hypothetical protein ABB55_03215 [Prosthecomicrobium hirschii]|uniref:Uncharacterized protein n=1 Tax=Prosthecodimorpha hirschii TaxID=665126 RepID=A0A0P6VWV3_9HYPH|nr:hypothetical protein [Prosthecomicrobium hirschii]KPL51356.1 hypothetical protein ABB55_03215 [Prosthecomicrobium hirschii]